MFSGGIHKQNEHSEFKNLVNQNFSAQKPNQMWLSDITYIHTVKHGWTYLASVLDVCTRKIVGYSYGRKMDRSFVISALTKARLKSESSIISMDSITVIAFTQLLIICHLLILKNLYFILNPFRIFVSKLLTVVHFTMSFLINFSESFMQLPWKTQSKLLLFWQNCSIISVYITRIAISLKGLIT